MGSGENLFGYFFLNPLKSHSPERETDERDCFVPHERLQYSDQDKEALCRRPDPDRLPGENGKIRRGILNPCFPRWHERCGSTRSFATERRRPATVTGCPCEWSELFNWKLIWWDEASGKLTNIYWQVFSSSYCKNMPGQECSMEPRQVTNCCTAKKSHHWIHAHALLQVCQPSCPQTNYCNTCTQFASTGGFAKFFFWKFLSFIGRFRQVPETHLPQFHRHRHGWNVILKEPLEPLERDPQGVHSSKFSFLLKPLPIQAFF